MVRPRTPYHLIICYQLQGHCSPSLACPYTQTYEYRLTDTIALSETKSPQHTAVYDARDRPPEQVHDNNCWNKPCRHTQSWWGKSGVQVWLCAVRASACYVLVPLLVMLWCNGAAGVVRISSINGKVCCVSSVGPRASPNHKTSHECLCQALKHEPQ